MNARKWIQYVLVLISVIILSFATMAYVIDPFMQFRTKDNKYMLNGWYVSGGLIRNYDYNTLMIGSSVTQNFDMDQVRTLLDVEPLHIGIGGLHPNEINDYMDVAYAVHKADTYYICVDLPTFVEAYNESRIPDYTIKIDIISRLHYLLCYEVWFEFIPVDLALTLAQDIGINLPSKFSTKTSIDKLGDWSADFSFGKEIVINNYLEDRYSVSKVITDGLYERMISNIDQFVDRLDLDQGNHVFFFPPYSSLYWCDAQDEGYFEDYLQAKKYFADKVMALGARVYDFQAAEFTLDLDNYKDTTHYSPEINDWMVECFTKDDWLIYEDKYSLLQEKLIENTRVFRDTHENIFVERY